MMALACRAYRQQRNRHGSEATRANTSGLTIVTGAGDATPRRPLRSTGMPAPSAVRTPWSSLSGPAPRSASQRTSAWPVPSRSAAPPACTAAVSTSIRMNASCRSCASDSWHRSAARGYENGCRWSTLWPISPTGKVSEPATVASLRIASISVAAPPCTTCTCSSGRRLLRSPDYVTDV